MSNDRGFCESQDPLSSYHRQNTKSGPPLAQKAIQYYSVAIYGQVGISGQETLKYQAINSILALIAQASCVLFIDKVGRRWSLIGGNLINSLMFMIATILIATYGTSSGSAGWGFIVRSVFGIAPPPLFFSSSPPP